MHKNDLSLFGILRTAARSNPIVFWMGMGAAVAATAVTIASQLT
jgi:hypothetical protein